MSNVEQATAPVTTLPFITVVMVVRNEGPFIAKSLEQVLEIAWSSSPDRVPAPGRLRSITNFGIGGSFRRASERKVSREPLRGEQGYL